MIVSDAKIDYKPLSNKIFFTILKSIVKGIVHKRRKYILKYKKLKKIFDWSSQGNFFKDVIKV